MGHTQDIWRYMLQKITIAAWSPSLPLWSSTRGIYGTWTFVAQICSFGSGLVCWSRDHMSKAEAGSSQLQVLWSRDRWRCYGTRRRGLGPPRRATLSPSWSSPLLFGAISRVWGSHTCLLPLSSAGVTPLRSCWRGSTREWKLSEVQRCAFYRTDCRK